MKKGKTMAKDRRRVEEEAERAAEHKRETREKNRAFEQEQRKSAEGRTQREADDKRRSAEERKQRSADKKEKREAKRERRRIRRERKRHSPDSKLHQAMPLVMLALCVFFGICIYTQLSMGFLGSFVQNVCLGIFGCGAYFIPALFLLWTIRWHRAVEKNTLTGEMLFGVTLILLISVLWYTFGVPEEKLNVFREFYSMGRNRQGGGFLGNAIGFLLVKLLSRVGTAIVIAFLLLILGVVVFGIRPHDLRQKLGAYLKQRHAMRREQRRQREEERAETESQKQGQRHRVGKDFYQAKEVATVNSSPNNGNATGRDSFLVPEGKGQGQFTRTFFDVEAENPRLGTTAAAPSNHRDKSQENGFVPSEKLYDDDYLFGDTMPVSDRPHTTRSPKVTLAEQDYREEGENKNNNIDTGIPDIPAYQLSNKPVGTVRKAAEEYTEHTQEPLASAGSVPVQTEKAGKEPAPAVEETHAIKEVKATKEEKQKEPVAASAKEGEEQDENGEFVINKAHVITHIGAERVGTNEGKEGRQSAVFHSFPPLSLLQEDTQISQEDSDQEIKEKSDRLMETLANYGVGAQKSCASRGPRLTRYELIPNKGVRIRAIESLVDEIAMNLEAVSVRIEAPIPGKAAVGVEVPNVKYSSVRLRGLLDTDTFRDAPGKTTVCLGVDVIGVPVFADLEKMPHLLVAGATGMGKSVCINSILVSLLYKARPDEIKLILIDPKKVEFKSYANIPHLLVPVVTEPQKAAGALSWAVNEMERRYDIIERVGVRNIKAYNKTLIEHPEREPLPQIVIVIDELHDLMIQAKDAVEDSIARIAAKARAAGIILIIGTQRPSVNVITGVIKANIPSRIAFHVASQVDSRTILDVAGAEKLLNNGDMLFLSPGMQMMTPKRVQGAFLDDDEVNRVAEYLRKNSEGVQYNEAVMADMDRESEKYNKDKRQGGGDFPAAEGSGDVGSEEDLLHRAIEVALESGKISTSLLQRRLSVGFGKAARMIDRMEEMGIVGPLNGQKPREILITMDEYRAMRLKNDE